VSFLAAIFGQMRTYVSFWGVRLQTGEVWSNEAHLSKHKQQLLTILEAQFLPQLSDLLIRRTARYAHHGRETFPRASLEERRNDLSIGCAYLICFAKGCRVTMQRVKV
jgi:hypothetical protein